MNSAIAASDPLQHGRGQVIAAPALEGHVALNRSLLLIPVLAAMAWAAVIAVVWLAWHIL